MQQIISKFVQNHENIWIAEVQKEPVFMCSACFFYII